MNLDSIFKYKVGDIVHHRLVITHEYHPEKRPLRTPLLIVERIASECSGGVQNLYNVRIGGCSSASSITFHPDRMFQLNEIELED